MNTDHAVSVRFQSHLFGVTAALGLLTLTCALSVRAAAPSSVAPQSGPPAAMPMAGRGMMDGRAAMPSMPATQSGTMPSGGMMNADKMNNLGAMIKNMSAMMDNMSTMMATAPNTGKNDVMPMSDMARMSGMMKDMSDMMHLMGAMGSGSDKADVSGGMGGMCSCCEKMMGGMDMMGGVSAPSKTETKPAPQPVDTKAATVAPDATDHTAHH